MRHLRVAFSLLSAGVTLLAASSDVEAATIAPVAVTPGAPAVSAWATTRTRAHTPARAVATDIGAMVADPTSIPIAVTLPLRNLPALTALTDRIAGGGSGSSVLSSRQFLERHAPTLEQTQRVVAYLRANGFGNVSVAANRMLVTADGTPATIRAAFQAELHAFDVRGRRAFANVTDAKVPAALADAVFAVLGLQTVQTLHTVARRMSPLDAGTAAVVGLHPTQFPRIYGADGLPSAATATIGVITQGSMTQTVADLKTFAASSGYPPPAVDIVTVGAASGDTSGVDEWNLDTQTALAAAGGTVQSMALYTATTLNDAHVAKAFNRAVSDNAARVINVSLGECETSADQSGLRASADQIFQAAVAQGQTFAVASGDSGAYECGGDTSAQSYPAVSPYVMAIGGTALSTSAGSWLGESAWSCSGPSTCPQSAGGGTGGGASLTEAAPAWQTAAGVLGVAGSRGVPDLAFDAAPASGALILVNGAYYQIGGTSLAAPLFTGFYARIQAAHANGLGFPAATLYAGAASHPDWFHDVTAGGNGGYAARAGWDYVTGFGSLQVQNFSSSLGGGASAAWTTIAGEGQSFTVNGTQTVRYGSGSNWVTRTLSGSGVCSNEFFGSDPAPGVVKECQVIGSASAPPTWTTIAGEGESFMVSGTQTVRYGSGSSWVTRTLTGGGVCSNEFFGNDPAYGVVKACQVAAAGASTDWTRIAAEGQPFSVDGTRTVRYGSGSAWISTSVSGGGTCSNGFFGSDPLYGVVKECDVAR